MKEVVLCADFGFHQEGDTKIWVIETPVKVGDFVMLDDTILTVETEKATLEVPSPKAGRITNVFVKIGDVLSKHTPVIELEATDVSRQDFRGDTGSVTPAPSNSVFLVHGHNEALREMSARFMEKLGLDVVILDERVSRGDTIVEKLERHSAVQFAVVLMTADDVGSKRGGWKRVAEGTRSSERCA